MDKRNKDYNQNYLIYNIDYKKTRYNDVYYYPNCEIEKSKLKQKTNNLR